MNSTRWLLAALLCLPATAATAKVAPEALPAHQVQAKEWSYQAIEDLANRGLVHGFKDSKFLDGRSLSRFEMATLVKRVIDTVLEIPTPEKNEQPAGKPGTAATRNLGVDQIPGGKSRPAPKALRNANFTESDLGTIKRLADTYSVELAVIGVNMQEAMEKFAALEGRVEALEASLRDPEGPLQTVISNVARIDKVRFTGYLQARYQALQEPNERTASPDRPAQAVDSFTVRRMRLTANARPTDHVGIKWQFEGANATLETRDAWVDYFFHGDPAMGPTVTFGQFKAPFGFEIVQSSSVREVPERARVARFFWPDERDRGVKFASSTGGKYFYEVALMNGMNLGSRGINTNDNNNNKNVLGRARTTLLNGRLDLGASFEVGTVLRTNNFPGESGIGAANPRQNTKNVYGVDFQWFPIDGTTLRGEWMGGRSLGSDVSGYILTFIQNVGKKHQAVARYDWFGADDYVTAQISSPGSPLGSGVYRGTLCALNLGWIYHVDESTRLKFFYEINKRGTDKVNGNDFQWFGNLTRFEVITLF